MEAAVLEHCVMVAAVMETIPGNSRQQKLSGDNRCDGYEFAVPAQSLLRLLTAL